MKTLFTAALLLLTTGVATSGVAPIQTIADTRRETVMVYGKDNGMYYIGAGVILKSGAQGLTIVTAYHVARHSHLTIRTWDSQEVAAMTVKRVGTQDEAIVETDSVAVGHAYRAAIIATKDLTPVFVWGSPDGKPWTYADASPDTDTIHKEFVAAREGPTAFGIQCPLCADGDSGGGVFNASGELIGIVTAAYVSERTGKVLVTVGNRV